MQTKLPSLLLLFLPLLGCGPAGETSAGAEVDMADEDEPKTEMTADRDWVPLFNGENLDGWHKYGAEGEIGSAWKVQDDAIYLDAKNGTGGDIITDKAYANYELELDWKISDCGNSGIIYNVQESDEYDYPWKTGPEMQVLDDDCHPDGKIKTHRSGDLYDMVSVKNENVRPVGEWNTAKLVVTDGMVEHWLNGEKQVAYQNTGDGWKQMIEKSKFRNMPKWGMFTEGKISLQDHGNPVWFRNIRIRQLSK